MFYYLEWHRAIVDNRSKDIVNAGQVDELEKVCAPQFPALLRLNVFHPPGAHNAIITRPCAQ